MDWWISIDFRIMKQQKILWHYQICFKILWYRAAFPILSHRWAENSVEEISSSMESWHFTGAIDPKYTYNRSDPIRYDSVFVQWLDNDRSICKYPSKPHVHAAQHSVWRRRVRFQSWKGSWPLTTSEQIAQWENTKERVPRVLGEWKNSPFADGKNGLSCFEKVGFQIWESMRSRRRARQRQRSGESENEISETTRRERERERERKKNDHLSEKRQQSEAKEDSAKGSAVNTSHEKEGEERRGAAQKGDERRGSKREWRNTENAFGSCFHRDSDDCV